MLPQFKHSYRISMPSPVLRWLTARPSTTTQTVSEPVVHPLSSLYTLYNENRGPTPLATLQDIQDQGDHGWRNAGFVLPVRASMVSDIGVGSPTSCSPRYCISNTL
jgi:hypothetical protein